MSDAEATAIIEAAIAQRAATHRTAVLHGMPSADHILEMDFKNFVGVFDLPRLLRYLEDL